MTTENTNTPFHDISQIAADLLASVGKMKEIPSMYDRTCEKYERICREVPVQIESDRINIAVTGAIKSGKSTFINALLKDDFLKRGGGVVTSIVTRIRKSETPRAVLTFKSWDEINADIQQALLFCPDSVFDNDRPFDLRRREDRSLLQQAAEKLSFDLSIRDKRVRPETVLLNSVLEGWAACSTFVQPEENTVELTGDRFNEHMAFTGNPANAFFVKEAVLHLPSGVIDQNIEIADCQGSDSTDPSQLANILDYLGTAGMIVYIISSRTGLREADIKFLSIISEMGLEKNLLFVINYDLGEHETLADFLTLRQRIERELAYFGMDVRLWAFSSLYNLLKARRDRLSPGERARLEQWDCDRETTDYSDRMTAQFNHEFFELIRQNRFDLVLSNQAGKMKAVARGIREKAELFSRFLSKDSAVAKESLERLKEKKKGLSQLESFYESSMKSGLDTLKRQLYSQVGRRLKEDELAFCTDIKQFADTSSLPLGSPGNAVSAQGFSTVIYFLFHEYKKQLDTFIVENIHPKIIKEIRELEHDITQEFQTFYSSYKANPLDFIAVSDDIFPEESIARIPEEMRSRAYNPDIDAIKKILGIRIVPARFTIRYSAKIRVGAFAGFGFQSAVELFRRIVSKQKEPTPVKALEISFVGIKRALLKSVRQQIAEYTYNLKDTYFYPLIDALCRDFIEQATDQFKIYDVEVEKVAAALSQTHDLKKAHAERVAEIRGRAEEACNRLDAFLKTR